MSILSTLLKSGQCHQQAGQYPEAEACFQKILDLIPRQPMTLYLMGTVKQQMGDVESSMDYMRSAIANDPKQSQFYLHFGRILVQKFKVEEAIVLLRSAMLQLPLVAEIHDGLGILLHMKGLAGEAKTSFQQAIALNPLLLHPHLHLAVLLIQQGKHEEAIQEAQVALRIKPDSVEARIFLSSAYLNLGRGEDAIANLLMAQSIEPQHLKLATELSKAYLIMRNPSSALIAACQGLALKKASAALLVIQYYALWELGRDNEAKAILDLQQLIFQESLAPPPEYPTLTAFHANLKTELLNHPTLTWEPLGKTTRRGYQSGPLEEFLFPITTCFLKHLRQKIDGILAKLPYDADHPLLGNIPANYHIHAWTVILEPGGHQDSHIHPSGWLSGVYYLEIPPGISSENEEGYIELGAPPREYPLTRQPPVRTLQPEIGKLILFPSYTYHRTFPFSGQCQRICIAFDVMAGECS